MGRGNDMDIPDENLSAEHPQDSVSHPPQKIVGIGASAGGLEALETFFDNVPPDCGLAFVVVQHLSPDFKSLMDELLRRHTELTVHRVTDGMAIEANAIYLIPPKKDMIVSEGRLLLSDKSPSHGLTLPIDTFFRSLAQEAGEAGVGIILSGTGSDGSRGIRDIHAAGGLVLAQSPDTARFDGMPKSAIATGVVDRVLAPEAMPACLLRSNNFGEQGDKGAEQSPISEDSLQALFRILRDEYGIDFSYYKPSTVMRRIDRRLQMAHSPCLDDYVEHLRRDSAELNSLYQDLLIGVTSFFRDREAFAVLEREVIPQLLDAIPTDQEIRCWVAGCATGEEAYSLAMILLQHLKSQNRPCHIRIFATDVHPASLETASQGIYSTASLAELDPEQLNRFFVRHGDDAYQVAAELRKMVVFAPHNVVKDAPFTKLDLITCRNMLIYLQPGAQKKVLSLFHFALKTGGLLFLGPSESPGELNDEFEPVNSHWKIYRKRRDIRLPADLRLPLTVGQPIGSRFAGLTSTTPSTQLDVQLLRTYDALLAEFMPPGLLINDRAELVHSFGGAGKYLTHRDGRTSNNVFDLVDKDLKVAITGALQRAAKEGGPVTFTGVRVHRAGEEVQLKITARPVQARGGGPACTLISLDAAPVATAGEVLSSVDFDSISREQLETLETELRYTKENLQATVEELETSNEELQAANEELLASNEELQSTNEELHSVNEELYTVNAEYQRKIVELTDLTDDMENLLRTTDVAVIFLDRDLCIRKFTPKIAKVFQVVPQDVGRRIDSFSHNIEFDRLLIEMRRVIDDPVPFETTVRAVDGAWYLMRILPYVRKAEVEGVVLTLIDISSLKAAEEQARQAVWRRDQFLAMLSHELRNPLSAVLNAAQLLARPDADSPTIRDASGVVQRQAQQMARLLDDLLDVSRVTQGKISIHKEVIDVTRFVPDALHAVKPLINARGHTLKVNLPDEPMFILGDVARLRQIQENLLNNAAKYTPPGGTIWFSVERDGGNIVFRVRDTGVGMRPDMFESVFELFVQSQETLDRADGGMGVGLTLVKTLVELHGGNVRAHSDGPGLGSEFLVRLPAADPPQLPAFNDGQASAFQPSGSARTVLIVEDNADSREMLRLFLKMNGFDVMTAEDGEIGLSAIDKYRPQVAVLDIGLPKVDGYEVARRTRQTPFGRDMYLVALTGYGRPEDRQAVLQAGFDAHLVKPPRPDDLLRIVSTVPRR